MCRILRNPISLTLLTLILLYCLTRSFPNIPPFSILASIFPGIPSAQVIQPTIGRAISAVYATVTVEPTQQTLIRTRHFGHVRAIHVSPGQSVTQDAPLADIIDETTYREIELANAELAQARLRHSLGPPSLPLLKNKEAELKKLKALLDAGNIAPIEYQRAENELRSLQDRVKIETASLDHDLQVAEQRLKTQIQEKNQMTLRSPLNGTVLEIYATLGEFLPPQSQIMRIGSSTLHLTAFINEEDIGRLKPKMKGNVKLFAYPELTLTATLTQILPQAENQSYRALFTLDEPPPMLLPGMTGEINIITDTREQALLIPTRALLPGPAVYTVSPSGRIRLTPVTIGFRSIETTEILSGLTPNDRLIADELHRYAPGQVVRIIKQHTR
ncbi:MAG: efflux RND transporter periplasmic adaptor subunit [Methylacidiphilales bacterium]|nr:efflux RND transporter periplasmic adaptor subunit [Candidatus Methylacidiphilales bacterium]MDW8348892.1 efflux RND transporter periplasmic adaptor subunit [Verrucomicrobiae bacterium]